MVPGLEFFDALGETGLCRSLHSQWHGGRLGPKIAWLWPNPGGAGHIQLLSTPANDLHTRHTTQPRLANVRLHGEQQEEEEEEEGALYTRHVNNTCKLANNAEWEPQPAVLKWIGSSPARTSPHTRLLAGGRDGARPRGRVGSAAAAGSEAASMAFQQLADVAEKWCSNTPFELIATEETERRMDFYADPGVSFYVLCPDSGCGDNFHVWSESEDCLPFLQLAQDYISSCGKKTLHEILEKVFKSFRPLLGLPDVDDDAFEEYNADVEEEEPEADHQQMGVSQQ
nr:maturin [Caretta caretta]